MIITQCLLRGRGWEGRYSGEKIDRGNCDRKVQSPSGCFKFLTQGLFQVKRTSWFILGRSWFLCREKWQHFGVTVWSGTRQCFDDLFKTIIWEKYGPICTFAVDHYTFAPPPEILFVLYSQLLRDTPVTRTAAKSLVKINYRCLNEINSTEDTNSRSPQCML